VIEQVPFADTRPEPSRDQSGRYLVRFQVANGYLDVDDVL
jgi:hypothetical protein